MTTGTTEPPAPSPASATDGARPGDGGDEPLLAVRDLSTGFHTPAGVVKAVDGVSFDLERGRTLGVVGESGSGKTVLSRSIMGLLTARNVARSGSVRFDGTELTELRTRELRGYWGTEMAMVFQDPMTSLNPVVTIGRQVTEGMTHNLGLSASDARERAINGLRDVGLPSPEQRFNEFPHQLSGGMRQRVGIAIALACGPRLLFADEPTTALDVTVQAQILDLLAREQQDRFMGMILVTHDLGVVANRADDVVVMYAGQIVEKAPAMDLFHHVRMPYTEALLNSIPRIEHASHTRLHAIGGRPPDLINPPTGCRFAPRCPYVQQKCRDEEPPLVEDTPGHAYRCWFPVETSIDDPAPATSAGETT